MGSKAREGAKAVNLAFVLLDFQHVFVRRRALVYETENQNIYCPSTSLQGNLSYGAQ